MTSDGHIIRCELSVNELTKNGRPFLDFWQFCLWNSYYERVYNEETGDMDFVPTIDLVFLEPSADMRKNIAVWKVLDRYKIIWDDFENYPDEGDY